LICIAAIIVQRPWVHKRPRGRFSLERRLPGLGSLILKQGNPQNALPRWWTKALMQQAEKWREA
jgi:hypothetical protein